MHSLTFRVSGPQRRKMLIGAAIVTAVATMLGIVVDVTRSGLGGRVAAYAIGAGLGALISFYACASYAIVYTECTPTGIRTRGLGGRRGCPWAQVRDISQRASAMNRIAVVTTTSGRRFWLGAPVDGSVVRDPEFAEKLEQITDYWRMAVLGRLSGGEGAGRPSLGTTQLSDSDDRDFDIPWKPPPEWP